ncbi:MAG: YbjQ family protein [Porphyromonadaceae bacterium]|nr:YbjQ family protein [Porphyromonadaceae bacterium]
MLQTTTHTLQGYDIEQYYGVVLGETIIGANFFKDIAASIRDFIGGRSSSYERVVKEAQETAQREMVQRAEMLGANAVIAISFSYSAIGSQGSMLMVTCSGTAVRVRR